MDLKSQFDMYFVTSHLCTTLYILHSITEWILEVLVEEGVLHFVRFVSNVSIQTM